MREEKNEKAVRYVSMDEDLYQNFVEAASPLGMTAEELLEQAILEYLQLYKENKFPNEPEE
ncbi:MAG: hypothetical protein PHG44_10170 [Lentisphaeria bacterium]|nr:hypothetical protein [Lentisphaeria bacterium]